MQPAFVKTKLNMKFHHTKLKSQLSRSTALRYLAGFTLVELMVTISVLGILIALAAPSFQSLIERVRIEGQVGKLRTDLSYARTEAIRMGQSVHICKRDGMSTTKCGSGSINNWEQGWLIFVDTNSNNEIDAGEVALRITDPLQNSNAISKTGSWAQNGFDFTAQGLPNGAATACIGFGSTTNNSMNPNNRYLVIDRIGRLRVMTEDDNRSTLNCPAL
jgi:type IV fimbrial biogenesis protein FimT